MFLFDRCMLAVLAVATLTTGCEKIGQNEGIKPVVSSQSNSNQGPFGLSMGMTYEQIKIEVPSLKQIDRNMFSSENAIAPYPPFSNYVYLITKETGLCAAWTASKDIVTNDFGDQLQTEFHDIQNQLIIKYGSGKISDQAKAGSIWNAPNEFTRGLQREERTLNSVWDKNTVGHSLPNNIESITLRASASAPDRGSLLLSYTFNNFNLCVLYRLKDKADHDSL